jgi:hypothetical protein
MLWTFCRPLSRADLGTVTAINRLALSSMAGSSPKQRMCQCAVPPQRSDDTLGMDRGGTEVENLNKFGSSGEWRTGKGGFVEGPIRQSRQLAAGARQSNDRARGLLRRA